MICRFSAENFRSYRQETALDFQAANLPEFQESLLDGCNGVQFLPVCVLYGPNGGGKSNLIQAMSCLISTVVKPIHDLKKTRLNVVLQHESNCLPYLLDDQSRKEPTQFELFFQTEGRQYRYYLALQENQVVYESLHWKSGEGKKVGTLFEREGEQITLGQSLRQKRLTRSVNPKMSYLSFLCINYNLPALIPVQVWFESCIVQNYANPKVDRHILVMDEGEDRNRVLQAMNDMGIDLSGYRFDEETHKLYTQRTIGKNIFELDFDEESAGTKKLFGLLPVLITALQEGRLVILDELDAKLHPKLLRYIINLFKNPQVNQHGAQLVFTSHDMTTMKNTVFRRDEIWFVAQNSQHESELYSLYDIKNEQGERVKNTAAYDKQYLEGRYGADPYLQNLLSGEDWM